MNSIFKCVAGMLVLTMIGFYAPGAAVCEGPGLLVKSDKKTTRHKPQSVAEPELDIPTKVEEQKSKWWLVGVGVALVAALAAAGGGGGGGGGGGENNPTSGDIPVEW